MKPEQIYTFLGVIASLVGLWNVFSNKLTAQENRITILEKDIEALREFRASAIARLDSHDEQNKAILVLAEQVKSLGDDVRDLKKIVLDGRKV